jgi:hypothetical protein
MAETRDARQGANEQDEIFIANLAPTEDVNEVR